MLWRRLAEVSQMPTQAKPRIEPSSRRAAAPTSASERRRGIRLLIVSVVLAAAMFAMWWLVATTNRVGNHDAGLLPLLTLATLVPAAYHLARARYLRSRRR